MVKGITKYWAIFKIQVSNSFVYAGDLLSQSLSIILFLWVFIQLWRTTYGAMGQESIAGLTLTDTLWYLMLAETIILSKPRLIQEIATAVKDGAIAYLLNKPYNFLFYQASVGLGDSILRLVFNILAGGALVWILVGPPPQPSGWLATLLVIFIAWAIDFCIAAMIGLTAFFTEEVNAFEWVYSKMLFLLGGLLIPLDFFPSWLQTFARNTPFAYTLYGPARFFVDPTPERFIFLLTGQLVWLVILGTVLTIFYQRSVTRLTINGG